MLFVQGKLLSLLENSFTRFRFCKYVNSIIEVQISDHVFLNSHQRQVTQSLINHCCTKIVLDSCKRKGTDRSTEQMVMLGNASRTPGAEAMRYKQSSKLTFSSPCLRPLCVCVCVCVCVIRNFHNTSSLFATPQSHCTHCLCLCPVICHFPPTVAYYSKHCHL